MEKINGSNAFLISGITAALEALQRQDYIETKYILIKAKRDAENFEQEGGDNGE